MTEIEKIQEEAEIARRYKDLLRDTYFDLTTEDKILIRKAFDVALDAHKTQRRKSGEPYIYHPIAVAKIVAYEIGLGAVGIVAALMHDVVEDSPDYDVDRIDKLFGKTISKIIKGLTKIEFIKHKDVSTQTENYRKLLLTLSEDIRVILIKLADRLHNMRTMEFMPPHKQSKIAAETLFLYAPLAHRLGLYKIKTELENLSLKYTEPEFYSEISEKLKESREERHAYIVDFTEKVKEKLDYQGIIYHIKGRPKSIYSIYKKMADKKVSFDEVYDKFAIRIIYQAEPEEEKITAWKIYSIVTDVFKPNPSRLRDWISQPKSTGYEALHTTVLGLHNHWVEIQIRSERMDEIAEKGVATHYRYKHGGHLTDELALESWVNKIKDVIENEDIKSNDFINNIQLSLYMKEIFVFTPRGDLKSLPKGATALDFAYSIHSGVGDHCAGAKINGFLRPISYVLRSGEHIEIITSNTQKPTQNWLEIAQTSKARSKIRATLKEEKKRVAQEGKEILARKLRHLKINISEEVVNALTTYFRKQTSLDLFYEVGISAIDSKALKEFAEETQGGIIKNILKRFRKKTATTITEAPPQIDPQKLDRIVFGPDREKLDYSLAICCNPIAGDDVFGFITINHGIKIHQQNCPNAISLRANYAYRILEAQWIDSSDLPFRAVITITGLDRKGIATDITQLVTKKMKLDLKGINLDSEDGVFEGKLKLQVRNQAELQKIIEGIKKIEGITKAERQK